MELRSTVSIAHGLKHTDSLRSLDVSGNPIGQQGMRLLMQAMSFNKNTQYTVNMKDISAEHERKDTNITLDKSRTFDPKNPEG
jgi:Ran GTPase-activating protein (RanGAP) involved in mRNA processing and transport